MADTSGLMAALDFTQPGHGVAGEAITTAGLLILSPLLLAELDHVATREFGREAALSAVDDLRRRLSRGRVVMPETTKDHPSSVQSVRARYDALDLDLAAPMNVALAAGHETDAILTSTGAISEQYVPWAGTGHFRVLPDGLPIRRERPGAEVLSNRHDLGGHRCCGVC